MNLPEFNKIPDAIAIDLDGTLLDSSSKLSVRNKRAMENCTECGVPVIIATSRPIRSVRRLIGNELADICSHVLLNGAIAIGNPPLSGYHREILPDDIARGIVNYALRVEPEATIGIELDGYKFGANWDISPSKLREQHSATPDMLLSLEESLELKPSKVNIGGIGTRMLDHVEELKEQHSDLISIVHSFFDVPMIMITTAQATKTNALKKLLGSINSLLDNVVAIGDDIPDIEMLQECGIPIAIANAIPEVKEICAYSTASNDDDGVAIVLDKIVESVK
ncbi:HAD-IIB family hydrolase [Chloroflexota bacterium]